MVTTHVYDGGSPVSQNHDVVDTGEESRYMCDVITDRFRQLQRRGEIIMNPMQSIQSTVTGSCILDYRADTQRLIDGVWTTQTWFSVSTDLNRSARFRLPYTSICKRYAVAGPSVLDAFNYAQVKDQESAIVARALANANNTDIASLVFCAELDKSIDYFIDLTRQVTRINNFLERTRAQDVSLWTYLKRNYRWKYSKSQIPKFALATAGAWLGYRYGLMNTYYDCVGILKAGSNVGNSRRGRFTSSVDTSYDSGLTTGIVESTWGHEETSSRKMRHTKSTAGCLIRFDPSQTSTSTFGGENVLTAAWELVPYSFLVDWFIDVGKRISALEGIILRPSLGSWITHKSELLEIHDYAFVPETKYVGSNRYFMPHCDDRSSLLDRTVYVERIANPKLSVLPELNVKLNTSRIVDSVSLMAQQASRLAQLLRK